MDRRLWTLMGIVFLDMMGITVVIPILPSLLLDLEHGIIPMDVSAMSDLQISKTISQRNIMLGWLIACYPMAQFFGAPILGTYSDVVGRKKILRLSLIGSFIGYIGFIMGIGYASLGLLLVSRLLDGFTGGNVSIAFSAIADISKEGEKSKNFGIVSMAFGLGFILGPFLGGILSSPDIVPWFDYSTPFYFTAILCLINIWAVTRFFKETNTQQRRDAKPSIFQGVRNIGRAFKYEDLKTLFFVFFLYAFGFNFFTQFFQVYLIEKFDFDQVQIGNTFGWIGLFILISQGFLNRKLSMKYPAYNLVSVFLLSLSLSIAALLLPETPFWIYMILPFMATSQAMVSPNLLSMISEKAGPDRQGEILGVNQSVQAIAGSAPPIISGYLVNFEVGLPMKIGALLVFAAFCVFLFKIQKGKLTRAAVS